MLRLSTSLMYSNSLTGILEQEAAFSHVQQQISSGRQVLTPADDPLAAAQEIKLGQAQSINTAYTFNRDVAKQALSLEEVVLSQVITLMHGVLTRVIEAGNGTYGDADWQALRFVIEDIRTELLNQANTMDSDGQYLFSGYLSNMPPYDTTATYVGDRGQRMVQIDQSRVIESGDIGTDIFNRATPGADEYVAEATSANTGTGTFGSISVVPGGANVGRDFLLSFQVGGGGGLEYVVTVTPPGTSQPPVPYVPGTTIDMGGVSLTMKGTPAPGDTFMINTAQTANMDLFNTLDQLVIALGTQTAGDPLSKARLENVLTTSNQKLRLAYDNMLLVRASVGARLNELDDSDIIGNKRDEFYARQEPDLTRLLTSTITERDLRKVILEAAIQTFRSSQDLNLFTLR